MTDALPELRQGITHALGTAGTGRTTMALLATANALREGHPVLFVDWMCDLSPEHFAYHGIDYNDKNLMVVQPGSQMSGLAVAMAAADNGVPFIVLDGFGLSALQQESKEEVLAAWAEHLRHLDSSGATVLVLEQVRRDIDDAIFGQEERDLWSNMAHVQLRLHRAVGTDQVSYTWSDGENVIHSSFELPKKTQPETP